MDKAAVFANYFFKNQKLEFSLDWELSQSLFSSNYSLHSSWFSLYKLCTSGYGQFILFFLADLLRLCQIGWEASELPSRPSPDVLWGLGLGFGPRLVHKPVWCRLGRLFRVIVVLKGEPLPRSHSGAGFLLAPCPCCWVPPKTTWPCHHHASP